MYSATIVMINKLLSLVHVINVSTSFYGIYKTYQLYLLMSQLLTVPCPLEVMRVVSQDEAPGWK